ncbi:hypothetical protein BTJ39_11655 [Izhakiella australiensis]|uniref:Phosphatidic acid phosphatase type 2/haloperoxidase domain-containing protein n=1 Tax=Izhakiella australiensis TaxID=1926881 RepID=A0A1S8YLD3_9GAMM|nr:phosphatase PAP2 family protein [Izhakiella australiensis]OON39688.1 hypothetical protein BTJ39_11655 [Izhakiella australiensis]
MYWKTLTYFGDSMLLIPTAIILTLVIPFKSSDKRTLWYWIMTFGLAGLIVSLSKIAFLGFGIGSARFNFTGFSGHSAMSATLWPVMLWLLSGRLGTSRWRYAAIAVGYFIPLMVGASRLALHYHSTSEVIAGLILGYTLSSAFLMAQRSTAVRGFSLLQLAAALAIPLMLMGHGRIATTQQFLAHLSVKIAGIEHPWTRAKLLSMRD